MRLYQKAKRHAKLRSDSYRILFGALNLSLLMAVVLRCLYIPLLEERESKGIAFNPNVDRERL